MISSKYSSLASSASGTNMRPCSSASYPRNYQYQMFKLKLRLFADTAKKEESK